MTEFARIAVRSPQPFDIVGDTFSLCGLGTSFEGVIGSAVLYDSTGAVLFHLAPMHVQNNGFGFTLFDYTVFVGNATTPEGELVVYADNPSGLDENAYVVTVPVTFGRILLGAPYGGFSTHQVVSGDTLSALAQQNYGDATQWPRLFTANRDRISNPDVIRVGQVLRIPLVGS
ncbi:MAG TPA: LysM peptidoglycan-binding domain-containing protein [Mycobacterium sp.]